MVLDGGTQRLNQKDILLAAIGLQLYFDAVVGETLQLRRQQWNVKLRADLFSQRGMSTTTEDGNRTHRGAPRDDPGSVARRLWQTGWCRSSGRRRCLSRT